MLYVLLLVLAQVLLEVFPVSSSGHMSLVELFFGLKSDVVLPAHFDHFLHGPMIFILMFFFRDRWYPFIALVIRTLTHLSQPIVAGDLPPMTVMRSTELSLLKKFCRLVLMILVADSITGVMYGAVRLLEKHEVVTKCPQSLLLGFFFTGLILLLLKFRLVIGDNTETNVTAAALPWRYVILLGFAQGVGLFPGISRFACTYVLGRCLGLSARTAFEFSFLLLYPLIVFAFFINGVPSMLYLSSAALIMSAPVVATILGGMGVAYFCFGWVYQLALEEKLWRFSLYMIIPITLVALRLAGVL